MEKRIKEAEQQAKLDADDAKIAAAMKVWTVETPHIIISVQIRLYLKRVLMRYIILMRG
jgi:hypothetical protein